jgi:hypothetical protein
MLTVGSTPSRLERDGTSFPSTKSLEHWVGERPRYYGPIHPLGVVAHVLHFFFGASSSSNLVVIVVPFLRKKDHYHERLTHLFFLV